MPAPIYIYSLADLGIPAAATPLPGDIFTTSATPTPDLLNIFDDDSFLDTISFDLLTGAPIIDFNQVLAANLTVDGALVGNVGDLVFTDPSGLNIVTDTGVSIDGYLVFVVDSATGATNAVGFVTTLPVPPNTEYTYTGPGGLVPVPYDDLACFTRDTMIDCENGPVAVQDIVEGDLVVTRNNGLQAVRWAMSRSVAGRGEMAPIRVKAGALGNAVDLRFSPMHRVLISGPRAEVLYSKAEVLAHVAHLCDGDQIFKEPCGEVTYYHILFDHHEIIRAHGCWSESFAPSEAALDVVDGKTRAELLKLFPELDQDWQDALPTLTAAEAQLAI